METVEFNRNLPQDEKLQRLKDAKGGTWYDGWSPYCLNCSTVNRMEAKDYGFCCRNCNNMIGFNLQRLVESPTNRLTVGCDVVNRVLSKGILTGGL